MKKPTILKHRVIKSGLWYTVSNFFLKGVAFFTIPIFTRILTVEEFGNVSVYMSFVAILSILISLGLRNSVQKGFLDFNEKFEDYVSSILLLSFIFFIIFLAVFYIFYDYFSILFNLKGFMYFFLILHAYFQFVYNFVQSKNRINYKYKTASILNILISIFSISLSIFLIKSDLISDNTNAKVLGTAIFPLLIGFCFLIYFLVKGKNKVNITYWKTGLVISLPLIFHNLSGVINSQFDRIVISKYLGASQTGIYSFSYSIGVIITVVWVSMNRAFNPYFYEQMQKKEFSKVRVFATYYRDLFVLVYLVLLYISPELVRIMAPETYWEGFNIIPWIFFALFFQVLISFESKIEYVNNKTHLTAAGTLISSLINIVLNILLVPKYGYEMAAITTVISYVFLFIYHYFVTKVIIKDSFYGIKFHLKAIIIVSLSTIIYVKTISYPFIRFTLAVCFIIIGLFYIKKIIKQFSKKR